MKKVRIGCFETNSSSSHSISFSEGCNAEFNPDVKFNFNLGVGYGWERQNYTSPNEIANYIIVSLLNRIKSECAYENRLLSEHFNVIKNDRYVQCFCKSINIDIEQILSRLWFNGFSYEEAVEMDISLESYALIEGYIDHLSADIIYDEVKNLDDIQIVQCFRDMIFGDTCIHTDNDN